MDSNYSAGKYSFPPTGVDGKKRMARQYGTKEGLAKYDLLSPAPVSSTTTTSPSFSKPNNQTRFGHHQYQSTSRNNNEYHPAAMRHGVGNAGFRFMGHSNNHDHHLHYPHHLDSGLRSPEDINSANAFSGAFNFSPATMYSEDYNGLMSSNIMNGPGTPYSPNHLLSAVTSPLNEHQYQNYMDPYKGKGFHQQGHSFSKTGSQAGCQDSFQVEIHGVKGPQAKQRDNEQLLPTTTNQIHLTGSSTTLESTFSPPAVAGLNSNNKTDDKRSNNRQPTMAFQGRSGFGIAAKSEHLQSRVLKAH